MTFYRNLISKLKKFYHLKILKRRYFRYGKCACCGACCENIYVRHDSKIIKTEDEFEKIKAEDDYIFYQHINIIGKDEFGLVFECQKFDKEKRLCTDHKKRPPICKKYPTEDIFKMGAMLCDKCGYYFEPIEKFDEVMARVAKKPLKTFEELTDTTNVTNS